MKNFNDLNYSDPKSKLKENLQGIMCHVCMDIYSHDKKPLILVCGHTFCEVCLQNLFDTANEIQCCFCKVITKLDKFDDMIVNYALLTVAEMKMLTNEKLPKSASLTCKCEEKPGDDKIENLLECLDCRRIVCPNCMLSNQSSLELQSNTPHKNHKLTNFSDFISKESDGLSDFLKSYRDLASKYSLLTKKIDKFDLEKIIKSEKEQIIIFFRELRSIIDKNQEMMTNTLDKLLKDSYKELDSFKKEIKFFNSDSNRYCAIVEELSNYKNLPSRQKTKLMNIYNINFTLDEIKEFNHEVQQKIHRVMSPEDYIKKFSQLAKNCELYRKKMMKFHSIINEKSKNIIEKGFEKNLKFYSRKA
jgi:hypothetical protein